MRRTVTLCVLFLLAAMHSYAVKAPYSILVAGGTLSLVPLHALSDFLGAKVKMADDDPNAFSLAFGDVYGDYVATQKQAIIDDKENDMPVAPLRYAGELFLPVRWLAATYGFTVDWSNAPVVKAAEAGKSLAFPVRVLLPEVGEQYGVPYGVRVNGTACLRLDALPTLFGAKWSEQAPTGKQTLTLNGHTITVTPYSAPASVDNETRTLNELPVRYDDHLYVPAHLLAAAVGLTLARDAAADTFILRNPAGYVQANITITLQIAHIAADFAGDGVTEQAYATLAVPGKSTPSQVWVTRGTHTIWQRELGNGMDRCIVKLQARDLTGTGRPALVFGCCFVDGYVSAVGLAAYQWQNETHTFRNLLDTAGEDGLLRYPASNHGDGGILLVTGVGGGAPVLIQYQTLEPFTASAHYQARWYRWNGHAFHLIATRRTRAHYRYADDRTAVAKALSELHVAGVPLVTGVEQ